MTAKTLPVVHPVAGVKICGVTCVDDAILCAGADVEWIGLNFHPSSPRSIRPEDAAGIIAALPASVSPVGLFVDRPAAEVADVAERLGLQIVQLHGQEPPEDLLVLRHLWLVRAFRLRDASGWRGVTDYLARAEAIGRSPDAILIDAHVAGHLGGTGATVASDVLDCIPASLPRLILAGGLTPENVAAKVAQVRPWMVDVASGVECSPGRKDPGKVAAFVKAAERDSPMNGSLSKVRRRISDEILSRNAEIARAGGSADEAGAGSFDLTWFSKLVDGMQEARSVLRFDESQSPWERSPSPRRLFESPHPAYSLSSYIATP